MLICLFIIFILSQAQCWKYSFHDLKTLDDKMYFGPESDGESFEYVTTLKPFIYSKTYT